MPLDKQTSGLYIHPYGPSVTPGLCSSSQNYLIITNSMGPDTRSNARIASDREKLQSIILAGPVLAHNFRDAEYDAIVQGINTADLPPAFDFAILPVTVWRQLALYAGHVIMQDAAEFLALEQNVRGVCWLFGVEYGADGLGRELGSMRVWDDSRAGGQPLVGCVAYIRSMVEKDARVRWALADRRERMRVARGMLESADGVDEEEPGVKDEDAGGLGGAIKREEEVKREGDVKQEDGADGVEIKREPIDDM